MAQPLGPLAVAPADMAEVLEKAFDSGKPQYYANIYYVSGTTRDLRIAFGSTRPIVHERGDLRVDKFDCSIFLTHDAARELAETILQMLERVE